MHQQLLHVWKYNVCMLLVHVSILCRASLGLESVSNTWALLQTFIYVLCQTGIRMNLQQFLRWGPSRQMQAMSSWQAVATEEK